MSSPNPLCADGSGDRPSGESGDRPSDSPDEVNPRSRLLPGLAAVALFAVLAAAIVTASIDALDGPMTFPAGESIVKNIGFALVDLELGEIQSEGFLAAFLIVALLLDVAIDAAIFLAKREEGGVIVTALGELRATVEDVGLGTDGGRN